jgi:hypothetical protein
MKADEMLSDIVRRIAVQGEPRAILVVWTDPSGCVNIKSSGSYTETIGMAVYAHSSALTALLKNPEEPTITPSVEDFN